MATTNNTATVTNASMMRLVCKFLATTVPEEFKAFCAAEDVPASEVAAKASKHLAALEKTGKNGSHKGANPGRERLQGPHFQLEARGPRRDDLQAGRRGRHRGPLD